ncbi:MAG: ferredoxin oxidoreductase [Candidatus Komeilibacteria bacterium]
MKKLLTGNEVIVQAALAAGALGYAGYPITPATEIMTEWDKAFVKDKTLRFLQTEDEMSAGFVTIGMIMGGVKAFTATAGPGNTLMQDPLTMAENMRIPMVVIIAQRGGPSTGSVIYSQQEVILSGWGGNSEGYRVVYSPANIQELYDYTIKAFNTAWTHMFPTIVLTDGYVVKTRQSVDIYQPKKLVKSYPLMVKSYERNQEKELDYQNLSNTFVTEEQSFEVNMDLMNAFKKMTPKVVESEVYQKGNYKTLIIAHGLVAGAAKEAVDLKGKEKKFGLFRPITLNPFPINELKKAARGVKQIIVAESAHNQLQKLVKEALYGEHINIKQYGRPGLGITPEELIKLVK